MRPRWCWTTNVVPRLVVFRNPSCAAGWQRSGGPRTLGLHHVRCTMRSCTYSPRARWRMEARAPRWLACRTRDGEIRTSARTGGWLACAAPEPEDQKVIDLGATRRRPAAAATRAGLKLARPSSRRVRDPDARAGDAGGSSRLSSAEQPRDREIGGHGTRARRSTTSALMSPPPPPPPPPGSCGAAS